MLDEPLVIDIGSPDACVIWLHGLGADGHDFEPIVPELGLDPALGIRFIFPHAEMMPVTINQGFVMRAWFDISSANIDADQDEDGIRASAGLVDQLVDAQIDAGIAPERIILAGFSQGGAVVLHAGLRSPHSLAGVLALSTFLPLADTLTSEKSAANADLPIFLAHGSVDPVIPVNLAYQSRGSLEALGYPLEWHEYPGMAHSVSQNEIEHIGKWMQRLLA